MTNTLVKHCGFRTTDPKALEIQAVVDQTGHGLDTLTDSLENLNAVSAADMAALMVKAQVLYSTWRRGHDPAFYSRDHFRRLGFLESWKDALESAVGVAKARSQIFDDYRPKILGDSPGETDWPGDTALTDAIDAYDAAGDFKPWYLR